MNGTKALHLSSQEQQILRDLVDAANKASILAGQEDNMLLPSSVLSIKTARELRRAFDYFQITCVQPGNSARRVWGEAAEAVIGLYWQFFAGKLGVAYTVENVLALQEKVQGFIKTTMAEEKIRPRILYIADMHFYHRRLCHEMDNRGFANVDEMNDHMIAQWNKKVTSKDEVYILGDLSVGDGWATSCVVEQLNGRLHLIVGNHDRYLSNKYFDHRLIRTMEPWAEIRDHGRKVIMCHYPVFCYPGQYRRDKNGKATTYMLYGHVHNTHDEVLVNRFIMETRAATIKSRHSQEPEPIPCQMINCFCMFSNYQPMTLDEWIEIDKKRRAEMQRSIGMIER